MPIIRLPNSLDSFQSICHFSGQPETSFLLALLTFPHVSLILSMLGFREFYPQSSPPVLCGLLSEVIPSRGLHSLSMVTSKSTLFWLRPHSGAPGSFPATLINSSPSAPPRLPSALTSIAPTACSRPPPFVSSQLGPSQIRNLSIPRCLPFHYTPHQATRQSPYSPPTFTFTRVHIQLKYLLNLAYTNIPISFNLCSGQLKFPSCPPHHQSCPLHLSLHPSTSLP